MNEKSRIKLGKTTFLMNQEEVRAIEDYFNTIKSYFSNSDNLQSIIEIRENMIADILKRRKIDTLP